MIGDQVLSQKIPERSDLPASDSGAAKLSLLTLTQEEQTKSFVNENAHLLDSQSKTTISPIHNLAAVYGEIVSAIPAATFGTIQDDFKNHAGSTAAKIGLAAGLGFGSALLLARSPVLAKSLLGIAGFGGVAYMGNAAYDFSSDVTGATNLIERNALAQRGAKAMGRFTADLIETTPGLLLGTRAGLTLSPRVQALDNLAASVRDKAEFAARSVVPERMHYTGFDAKTVSTAKSPDGKQLFAAGEEMLKATPWRGVEEARLFKFGEQEIKISARLPGTQSETFLGRRAENAFHTHESRLLPTSSDYTSVRGAGVIGVPEQGIITFYEGRAAKAEQIIKALKAKDSSAAQALTQDLHNGGLPALVLDPKRNLAVTIDLRFSPSANSLVPTEIRAVNYSDAVNRLSNWQGKLNIESLSASSDLMQKPGMTELMSKLAAF